MEKFGIAESDTEQEVFICMDGNGNRIELHKESMEKIPYQISHGNISKSCIEGVILTPPLTSTQKITDNNNKHHKHLAYGVLSPILNRLLSCTGIAAEHCADERPRTL
jgi:hypothetical protein